MYNNDLLQQRVALARRSVNLGMNLANDAELEPRHGLEGDEAYFNCANLVPYLLGLDAAHGPNGEAFYSAEKIYADATGPNSQFTRIELPIPGCLLVVPSSGLGDDFVGIVTKTEPLMGVACNKSNLPEPVIESSLADAERRPNRIFALLNSDLR